MGNLDDEPKDQEEARFNEALKRMLKTPPVPKIVGSKASKSRKLESTKRNHSAIVPRKGGWDGQKDDS